MSKERFVNSVKQFIDRKNLASEFIKKYSCNNRKNIFVWCGISSPSFVKEIKTELLSYVKEEQIYSFDVELYQYYGGSYETYKDFILEKMKL